jgi:hypothetical protein
MPEDVRNWIASAAQVASDSARYYDADSSSSDAVLAWLEAQPAAPERREGHAVTIPDDVREAMRQALEFCAGDYCMTGDRYDHFEAALAWLETH